MPGAGGGARDANGFGCHVCFHARDTSPRVGPGELPGSFNHPLCIL